jgi:hypothetical protein
MKYYSIKPESFGQLTHFNSAIKKSRSEIIEIKCGFLRPYCVAYLDQLLQHECNKREIKIYSTEPGVNTYLSQVKLKYLYKKAPLAENFPVKNIVPLKRIQKYNGASTEFVSWIKQEVLRHLPDMDKKLKGKIISNLWEVVDNVFKHSNSKYGLSVCGQFYPEMNYFELAFYDTGIGITNKVKSYLKERLAKEDAEYIAWALEDGHSTINSSFAGMGLFYLRNFLIVNQGSFQFVSENGYFGSHNSGQYEKHTLRNKVAGTLVNIRVNFDDNKYIIG